MILNNSIKLDFSDVLIEPQRSTVESRNSVSLTKTFFSGTVKEFSCVPIIAANMDTVATFAMSDALAAHGCMTAIHKHYTINELVNHFTTSSLSFYSMGSSHDDYTKLQIFLALYDNILPLKVCLDVANGHRIQFSEFVHKIRTLLPDSVIMAGNVATPEGVVDLIDAGADIVKIGIGSGSACITREVAGVGYPQFSCIMECASAADDAGGLICSDGGCTVPGDFAKAFGAGADFVMAGGIFGGHDESIGDLIEVNGKKYKHFYGMSSSTAMEKYSGGVADYRSSEGRTLMLPYKGPVRDTLNNILGGIRSACTYSNAENLDRLHMNARFVRVNNQLNTVFKHHEI